MITVPISICIPCFPRDTHKLKKCLKSIKQQSVHPEEVIIAHSEMSDLSAEKLRNKLQKNVPFKIIVANTTKKAYAAANRNRGASFCKCKYISFFDADDKTSKDHLQTIYDIIIRFKPRCIVHNYKFFPFIIEIYYNFKKRKNKKIIKEETLIKGKKMYDIAFKRESNLGQIYKYDLKGGLFKNVKKKYLVAHGHPTVLKSVLNEVSFNESSEFRTGEDCNFLRKLLKLYGRNNSSIIYTTKKLTKYFPSWIVVKINYYFKKFMCVIFLFYFIRICIKLKITKIINDITL